MTDDTQFSPCPLANHIADFHIRAGRKVELIDVKSHTSLHDGLEAAPA